MEETILDRKMAVLATAHSHEEPTTPKSNRMPLTEYSANISPIRENSKPSAAVPADYLLPNGYPDVSDKFREQFVNSNS